VNNAAVIQYGRFDEVPVEEWHQVIRTHVFGTYLPSPLTLAAFDEFLEKKGDRYAVEVEDRRGARQAS
jgi:NAD(P)-dependent dehydrogenase (short-subunit alcohol dehydrogenase family)